MISDKAQIKIDNLKHAVESYAPFLEKWNKVEVHFDRFTGLVQVTWFNEVEKAGFNGEPQIFRPFTRREFGVDEIDQRILSYKNKVKYELSKEEKHG